MTMSSREPVAPPWAIPTAPAETGLWGPPDLGSKPTESDGGAIRDPVTDAHSLGFDEGFVAGVTQARAELGPAITTLGRLVAEIERELGSVRRRAEANIFALGLAVARWLMQRAVNEDPSLVEPLIRRAVSLLPAGTPIEIHANAADVEVLTNALALTEPDGRPIPVHWVADLTLERGSFRLVSPERIVDGRADVALRSLYDRLAAD
jgi:flagellar biosynthesis/type III secretory pathway protein FliH